MSETPNYDTLSDVIRQMTAGHGTKEKFQNAMLGAPVLMPVLNTADGDPAPLVVEVEGEQLILLFSEPAPELGMKIREITERVATTDTITLLSGLQPGYGLMIEAKDGAVAVRASDIPELQAEARRRA